MRFWDDFYIYDSTSSFYSWLKNEKIYEIYNQEREKVVFYVSDGSYQRVNSNEGLMYLNQALNGLNFVGSDFKDSFKTNSLIAYIVDLYSKKQGTFFTNQEMKYLNEGTLVDTWLRGQREKLDEFYILSRYSIDILEDDQCKIQLNVFNIDGSVDSWLIKGCCNESNSFKIVNIAVNEVRKTGYYNYTTIGG